MTDREFFDACATRAQSLGLRIWGRTPPYVIQVDYPPAYCRPAPEPLWHDPRLGLPKETLPSWVEHDRRYRLPRVHQSLFNLQTLSNRLDEYAARYLGHQLGVYQEELELLVDCLKDDADALGLWQACLVAPTDVGQRLILQDRLRELDLWPWE